MNRFTTSWGDFQLTRFPEDPREQLRAWDAADEYLLRHLHGDQPQPQPARDAEAAPEAPAPEAPAPAAPVQPVELRGTVVVLGDRWGALGTVLAASRPDAELVQLGDSYLAQQATRANLVRAGLAPDAVRLLAGTEEPPERIDVLLIRVPKSLALLEDQLHRLAPALHPGTLVLGTGMVTEIHTSTLQLFERIIGPTRTSLAVKKARLIFCTPDPEQARPANPWPLRYALPGDLGPLSGGTVVNHGGVFCAERLDIGTRFLLQHLPTRHGRERVVDLGCGNGIVGTAAALANPEAELTFVDESFAAIASARETFRANTPADRPAHFQAGDALAALPAASVDLVLNNPPFHSHQATTDATAWRMFTGARRALRPGGELWVVGNRHLGYHVKLRRLFGNCQTVAGNPKFVILRAVKGS
ncbi:methyltransferase [Kitasatospora kifunensis]|uniref:Ribosomal RNA large subunit methyltransferase G n=1 Tax=Kitasatospora kifunensis TaxID=58351 RepID=A0A7W7VXP3_KITKI|nr:methyltransferase [Kitasatospora kifunensis]MBB4926731.1 16S rRNA (guanine1207-N2)-methyltransferase [Kitasatospora kifunensis]